MVDPSQAVLAALTAEGASGGGGSWPERSCVSLIRAVCRELGVPAPPYEPWEALGEREAGRKAIAEFGSMAAGHQGGLVATGHWEAVDAEEGLPRPGDVVSFDGPVLARNGELYTPPRPEAQMTGLCGIYGMRWVWTPKGLTSVQTPYRASWITRAKRCL